jgi:hypothetical protein
MHSMWPAKFRGRASRSQHALASPIWPNRAKTAWGEVTLCRPQFFGPFMIGGPIRRVPHAVRPAMPNFRAKQAHLWSQSGRRGSAKPVFLALLQKLARGLLHNAREGMPIFRVEKPHITML